MTHMALTRRSFTAGAAAALGVPTVLRAQTKTMRPVSCVIDWLHQGANCGFAVAREMGFYKDAGIDATLNQGKGSSTTAQIVASKAANFGFADGYVVANGVSKGMKVKMVGAVYRKNPTAVLVLEESSIKTPADLAGKTIGITTGSAQFQQWPAFARGAKLAPDQVRIINVDAAGTATALITGRVDAIAGFAHGWVPRIELRSGKKSRLFWYADYGVTAVSNGIIAHHDTLQDPALVRDFVRATIKGFLYARKNPDEMVRIIKKYQEASDPEIVRREAQFSWNLWVTPNTRNKPLGWMSIEDWKATVETLKQFGGVPNPPDASTMFTNDFVPMDAEFVPPQNA